MARPLQSRASAPCRACIESLRFSLSPDGLPNVIAEADAELYREIFRLQERGKWKAASNVEMTFTGDARSYIWDVAFTARSGKQVVAQKRFKGKVPRGV